MKRKTHMIKKINGFIIACVVLIMIVETIRGNYPWKVQNTSVVSQDKKETPSVLPIQSKNSDTDSSTVQ
jgi:hypothetical protein